MILHLTGLINIDSKEFANGDFKFQVAQVNTACIEDVLKGKAEIENAMQNFIASNGLNLFVFLITDIINSKSQCIVLGNNTDIFEKAFNTKLDNNMVFLVLSLLILQYIFHEFHAFY